VELDLRVFDHFYGGLLAEILLRGRYFEEVLTDTFGRVPARSCCSEPATTPPRWGTRSCGLPTSSRSTIWPPSGSSERCWTG
jgi:hypothetical protein